MKLKSTALILALVLMVCFAACDFLPAKPDKPNDNSESQSEADENLEFPVELNGAALEFRPGKVVSLSPSITEKLFDMGLQDRLEGISDNCDAPEGFGRKRVGTVNLLDLDEIERISPHLVLTELEFTEAETSAIIAMGAQVAIIPHASDFEGVKQNYKAISTLLDGKRTGGALGDAFNKKFQARLDSITQNAPQVPKNALYLRLLDYTVATGDTLEGDLIERIGLNNIANEYANWEYPDEDAKSDKGKEAFASIDFIFMDKRAVTIKMLENSTFYKGLNAVLKDYYLYIDSTALERQTMRTLDELERMLKYVNGENPDGEDEPEADIA